MWQLSPHVDLRNPRVAAADAVRQQATAAEVLRRLDDHPGLVLADEVGMGKTFVAFAVAVSVLHATGRRRPVVVMVPASVSEKWPRDWSVFQELCLNGGPALRATPTTVRRGSEFLKLLDDPARTRSHLIFLTHGALTMSLNDPFVRLAVVRQAFRHQRALARQRAVFPRWAAKLLNDRRFNPKATRRLLEIPVTRWRHEWEQATDVELHDDPIPASVQRALARADLTELRAALSEVPLRGSAHLVGRLRGVRAQLSQAVDAVWMDSLRHLSERLPLVILDEAHHVKNPNSLARLFSSSEAEHDADAIAAGGPLGGVFERMLFLTATPFQLGHRELINVLGRFSGARISAQQRSELRATLDALGTTLDSAQAACLRLERAWGRLSPADLNGLPNKWWDGCPSDASETTRIAAARIADALEWLCQAQDALRPWVIRHTKTKRRAYRPGRQILDSGESPIGLEVTGPAVLPFLLAARAQALVSLHGLQEHRAVRAYFADGLASSFEAFAETRGRRQSAVDDLAANVDDELPASITWYLERIASTLPETTAEAWSKHPKIAASTKRAVELWCRGDKTLLFCFYRATGRALRTHISRALRLEIAHRGAAALSLDSADPDAVISALEQRAESLLRSDATGAKVLADRVRSICHSYSLHADDTERTIEVIRRFMRTASFLVRFVDLRASRQQDAIDVAFDQPDGSGVSLTAKIGGFVELVKSLTEMERDGLWDALYRVQTGTIVTAGDDLLDLGEVSDRREAILPNVRLANGTVAMDTRHRLMRTFNTPFFPEVLIASSVMAEGVDLHLDCRHVIHHDLDWNPSTLEQRTGRLDRLGSKAERLESTIVVYEPYMGGTQDEKMYRVVRDRERWFSVMMGGHLDTSEWATDRLAERVPLPDELVGELAIDLSVVSSERTDVVEEVLHQADACE
jgi:hypothetical protein